MPICREGCTGSARTPRRCTQGAPWGGSEPVAGAFQTAPGSAPLQAVKNQSEHAKGRVGGVKNARRSLSQKGHGGKLRRERRPTLGGRECDAQPCGLPTASSDLAQPCCEFSLARPRRGKGCRSAGEAAPAPLFGARWPAHFKRRRAQPQHQLYTAGQHLNSARRAAKARVAGEGMDTYPRLHS